MTRININIYFNFRTTEAEHSGVFIGMT